MRKPYKTDDAAFTEDDIVATKNPIDQFHDWFQHAKTHPNITEPNAMCLVTATRFLPSKQLSFSSF